jgi:hypothetical protein
MLPQAGEIIMRNGFSHSKIIAIIAVAGTAISSVFISPASAQTPAASTTALPAAPKTPWGEPGKPTITGPHVMVVGPAAKLVPGYDRTGEGVNVALPYVMWKDTPYEHLMIPVK